MLEQFNCKNFKEWWNSFSSNQKGENMYRKYRLTDESIEVYGSKLYRIQAVRDFGGIKKGDLGGFVESESNLSHEGLCWVADYAKVYENARVTDNAFVGDYATVRGEATVSGYATVRDSAVVDEWARISSYSTVRGNSIVCWKAYVYGMATIKGNARVTGDAKIFEESYVGGNAYICDNASVRGTALIYGGVEIREDACIRNKFDYACVQGFGRANRLTTFYLDSERKIRVACGCFRGTLKEFKHQVKETHGDSQYAKEYLMIAKLMKEHFKAIERGE